MYNFSNYESFIHKRTRKIFKWSVELEALTLGDVLVNF